MDFNFRAPSPMFKEMNRLESPSLFFDDFKVDVNVSPSRFFTTTPPLWSPTKSLQESSSPTKSLLTNESPTFNCFVDNIQPNGLIPFKPQVVKLEENPLNSPIDRPIVSTTEENNQQQKNPLLNLESKGGAFEKFNNSGLDISSSLQNSFLNSAFSKIENSSNNTDTNPLIKLEQTNNNNSENGNNNLPNNNNNNNNVLRNNNPPNITNNGMFNNLNQQNKNMPNPFFPNNDFTGMNLMFGGGPTSAFSKMDNMPLFNQSLMTNNFPNNNSNNLGNNMKQGQNFHPNMMQMNPAMMQMMQMQMQMQNQNLNMNQNLNPNNNNNNNNGSNPNNNNLNNNNLNNNNLNNNMKQMGGGDSRFIKFESIVPMMNTNDPNNKNLISNMSSNSNMVPNNNHNLTSAFNLNPNMFFSVPTSPSMTTLNMTLNPNFATRAKNPLDQPNEEKSLPNKRQKSKKSSETKSTKNKDNNKHIKPKFTTEVNKNDLDLIQKKRTLDNQSPTFTDDGHLKNRVKEKKEVPDKIQCLGSSKKKGTQCKNAALLEYIGPRPLYCAEHIEEDKNSLHGKCKCPYFKEKGDGKPCKQIILKELVMCYRHFDEVLPTLTLEKARRQKNLVVEMIKKLRQDSKTFLKTNIDLYQRKSKLLPKYIKLDNILAKFIAEKEKTE